jgi:hypothetical protein
MGMNLYGYDYSKSTGRQDIVGSTFVDIIKENSVTITWSESDGEVMIFLLNNSAFFRVSNARG